jgi:hypothetical protein
MEIVFEVFKPEDCNLLDKAVQEPGFDLPHVKEFLKTNQGKNPLPVLKLPREESINLSQALAFIPKDEGIPLSKLLRKQIYERH